MEVELDDALLTAQPCEELAILAICALGWAKRHRVLPRSEAAWDAWAGTLPPDLKDQVKNVWKEGRGGASKGSASEQVRVVPTGPDRFDEQPLQLTPGEALNVLGRPLRVFLENGRYDRTFLLAFADGASHAKIVEAERAGWLVFETAGGITELVVRVEDAATQPSSREVFRAMYLCDSDARAPGQPDERAASVGKALVALGTHHHRRPDHFGAVLTRRAAENYAPPGDVLTWAVRKFGGQAHELIQQATRPDGRRHLASGTGNPGSDRRHLLAAIALRELQSQERTDVLAHLDMKHGRLHRDTPRNADIIWNQLDDFQQAALDNGFGEGFSGNFYGTSRALRDGTKEITRFLAKILERM